MNDIEDDYYVSLPKQLPEGLERLGWVQRYTKVCGDVCYIYLEKWQYITKEGYKWAFYAAEEANDFFYINLDLGKPFGKFLLKAYPFFVLSNWVHPLLSVIDSFQVNLQNISKSELEPFFSKLIEIREIDLFLEKRRKELDSKNFPYTAIYSICLNKCRISNIQKILCPSFIPASKFTFEEATVIEYSQDETYLILQDEKFVLHKVYFKEPFHYSPDGNLPDNGNIQRIESENLEIYEYE